jgi:2-polyprenyl-3-methyl-5-hydroxy-6-metoxy-1,4-benzoquinol methylase
MLALRKATLRHFSNAGTTLRAGSLSRRRAARCARVTQEPTPEEAIRSSRTFWNDITRRVSRDAPLSEFGTVTQARGVVALRDELEQALVMRHARLAPALRVLDLGGGAGRFALPIAHHVAHVTLVDLSEVLLEVARARATEAGLSNIRYVCAAIQEFEFDESYDLILIMNVATYLNATELDALATRCARALRPGGRLLLKEPVTTDGAARQQVGADPARPYYARFRPREVYAEVFGRELRLTMHTPTVAHFLPWFLGSTNEAAHAASSGLGALVFEHMRPLLRVADPWLLRAELALRARPVLAPLLAPVPVLQDLYVFEPRATLIPPARAQAPALSVVVIAFNEQACLARVVSELVAELDAAKIDCEMVLVDDGSSDTTLSIMRDLAAADTRVRVVPLRPNRGIGGALRAGFDAALGTHVTWVPADGQIPPEVLVELFQRRHEACMLTTVYRTRQDHVVRTVISSTLNRLIRLQTGQPAKSGGNYLFARDAWVRWAPPPDDSMMISTAFRQELSRHAQTIVEVPIRCRARVAGHSKVLNPRTIWRTLRALGRMQRARTP